MTESRGDNRPWSEVFYEKAQAFVDLDAAAQLLEDTKSSVLAQKCAALGDIPVNRAEQIVKSSKEWTTHIEKIVGARRDANFAKLELEYIRMKFSEWNNEEANNRVQAKL